MRHQQASTIHVSVQCKGFLLAHGRAISTKEAKDEILRLQQQSWPGGAAQVHGVMDRVQERVYCLDAGPFLMGLALAFCKSALVFFVARHLNGLKTDSVNGLVIVTLEQAAWASFKVSNSQGAYNMTDHSLA